MRSSFNSADALESSGFGVRLPRIALSILMAAGLASCSDSNKSVAATMLSDVSVDTSEIDLNRPTSFSEELESQPTFDLASLSAAADIVVSATVGASAPGWSFGEKGSPSARQERFVALTVDQSVSAKAGVSVPDGSVIHLRQGFIAQNGLPYANPDDPWLREGTRVVLLLRSADTPEGPAQPDDSNGFDDASAVFSSIPGSAMVVLDGAVHAVDHQGPSSSLCGMSLEDALEVMQEPREVPGPGGCSDVGPSLVERSSLVSVNVGTEKLPRTVIIDLDRVPKDGRVNVGTEADPEVVTLEVDALRESAGSFTD